MTTQTSKNWKKVKLGDVATVNPESIGRNFPFDRIFYVDISSVGTGVAESPQEMELNDAPSRAKRLVKDGDTILSTVRPNRRSFLYIKHPKENVVASTGFAVVRPEKVSSRYLYYVISNQAFTDYLTRHAKGSAYPAVDAETIENADFILPSETDQNTIADILSTYDNLIENNACRIQILEQTAQAVYTEWFMNFRFPGHEKVKMIDSSTAFGKMPQGWEVKKIEGVCIRIQAGGTPRRGRDEYWNNGTINWYTTGELQDNFLFGAKEKITERSIDETSAKIFDRGTILMAIYGSPTVGRLGITTERSSCNQAALGLVEDRKKITKTYLYYVLRNLREKFNLEAVGAAQQNISKIKVSETQCLVANGDLIEQFDVIAFPIFQELESLHRQNGVLRQTRDLLLPKLVRGEIRI